MSSNNKPTPSKKSDKPAGRVFDVRRPGKAPASPTSRPVIVGHKPLVQDSVASVSGLGAPSERRQLLRKPKGRIEINPDAANPANEAGEQPSGSTPEGPRPGEVVEQEQPAPETEEALAKTALDATTQIRVRTSGERRVEPLTIIESGAPKPEEAETKPGAPAMLTADSVDQPEPLPKPQPESKPALPPTPEPEPAQPAEAASAAEPEPESSPEPEQPGPVAEPTPPPPQPESEPALKPTPEPDKTPESPVIPPAASPEPPKAQSEVQESGTDLLIGEGDIPPQEAEAPKSEPEYTTGHPIVVSHHGGTSAWKVVLLLLVIVALAAVAVDILLDGGVLNWPVPHTSFFTK